MMKVSYYCGLRVFSEYVCIQHEGFAGRKARQWWNKRSDIPLPQLTEHAMGLTDSLKVASHLRIWINKQYPEIMDYCFDGTAFGTIADDCPF